MCASRTSSFACPETCCAASNFTLLRGFANCPAQSSLGNSCILVLAIDFRILSAAESISMAILGSCHVCSLFGISDIFCWQLNMVGWWNFLTITIPLREGKRRAILFALVADDSGTP